MTSDRYIPTRYAIAQYWILGEGANSFPDNTAEKIEDVCCFACGYQTKEWSRQAKGETIAELWEKSTLHKAHLTPKSLEGSNSVDNMVLICEKCHGEAPDYIDSHEMFAWMSKRKNWMVEKAERAILECEIMGLDLEQVHEFLQNEMQTGRVNLKKVVNRIGLHWTSQGLKPASFALAVRDAMKLETEGFQEETDRAKRHC